jgi:polysaccharide biosynthesis protein PslH
MRILQIAPQIPFPLTDGGKVGVYNITKHLALRGHSVTFATFLRVRDRGSDLHEFQKYCDLVTSDGSTDNSIFGAVKNIFSALPYNIEKYRSRELFSLVQRLVKERQFDVVHVDHLHMAAYGLRCSIQAGLPVVLREHNIESAIVERYARQSSIPPVRWYLGRQLRRIYRYEASAASQCDRVCVISKEDGERLRRMAPDAAISVIGAGIDPDYFLPAQPTERMPFSICFFGSLDWIANQDAVLWFASAIFPKIRRREPRATFTIIGKNAPPEVRNLGGDGVTVMGFVPDLRAEISRHACCVVPIRIGSGIRLKILDSFALRIPVVTTTVGCEGITARDGEELLIGDSPEEFAGQVLRILSEPATGDRISRNAFALADRSFRWDRIASQFEEVYDAVIRARKGKVAV